jgi:hypothetical protein
MSGLNASYRLSLYRHGTDHAENTVLLLRNVTTGRRELSYHCYHTILGEVLYQAVA